MPVTRIYPRLHYARLGDEASEAGIVQPKLLSDKSRYWVLESAMDAGMQPCS